MDHHLINGPSPDFGLAEIWPFSVAGGGESGCGFGFRTELGGIVGSRNGSVDESTVTEQSGGGGGGGGRKRRETNSEEEEESKLVDSTSSANDLTSSDAKPPKMSKSSEANGGPELKAEVVESSSRKRSKPNNQANEPPKDYIHVRARRGQATDSHSLAERARREKISERMRILQDLVPGCNKVIGKALVLDEIINYIQSLQRQVEFLSMKLEAVNSRTTSIGIEGFPLKDLGLQTFDSASIGFGSQAREFGQILPPEWLHMQVGGSFERAT